MPQPEEQARAQIDELLTAAGWVVTDPSRASLGAARGVVIRNFPLKSGHGFADYLFYVDGRAGGVIEAKRTGHTLAAVNRCFTKPWSRRGLRVLLPCLVRLRLRSAIQLNSAELRCTTFSAVCRHPTTPMGARPTWPFSLRRANLRGAYER